MVILDSFSVWASYVLSGCIILESPLNGVCFHNVVSISSGGNGLLCVYALTWSMTICDASLKKSAISGLPESVNFCINTSADS